MRAFFALICTAMLCSGCALTTATIDVPYQPLGPTAPAPGAAGITVTVSATDGRTTNQDRVGVKKNGYGMEMAPIVASNNIPDTVAGAFQQELAARGFTIGANGVGLQVQLVQFYNDFKSGFLAGDAVANVAFNVEVMAPSGTIVFTKYYQGTGDNPNIQIAGGDNARIALISAFQSAVASAVDDPAFIKALIAAGGKAPLG